MVDDPHLNVAQHYTIVRTVGRISSNRHKIIKLVGSVSIAAVAFVTVYITRHVSSSLAHLAFPHPPFHRGHPIVYGTRTPYAENHVGLPN